MHFPMDDFISSTQVEATNISESTLSKKYKALQDSLAFIAKAHARTMHANYEEALQEPLDGVLTIKIKEGVCGNFAIETSFDDAYDWTDKEASMKYNEAVRHKQFGVARDLRKNFSIPRKGNN